MTTPAVAASSAVEPATATVKTAGATESPTAAAETCYACAHCTALRTAEATGCHRRTA